MKQRKTNCSVGFVEVKPKNSDSTKRCEDMIRLTVFCKDVLEMQSTKATIKIKPFGILQFYFVRVCAFFFYLWQWNNCIKSLARYFI